MKLKNKRQSQEAPTPTRSWAQEDPLDFYLLYFIQKDFNQELFIKMIQH